MKKVLKFAGIAAAVLGLVALILISVCPVVEYHSGSDWANLTGGVFGGGKSVVHSGSMTITDDSAEAKLAWSGLIGWILMLVAILILVVGFVLPLLKVKAVEKFAGILNLVAVGCLIVAGVLVFVSKGVFGHANGTDLAGEWHDAFTDEGWRLGTGWIIGGILSILGGLVAICPTVVDLIGKKK